MANRSRQRTTSSSSTFLLPSSFLHHLLLLLLLLLLPGPACSLSMDHEYDYYYDHLPEYDYPEEDVGQDPPTFLAREQTFTVEVGQSVIIPCDAQNQGNHKLIIKKLPGPGIGWGGGGGGAEGGSMIKGVRREGGNTGGHRRGNKPARDPALGDRDRLLVVGREKVTRDRRISLHGSRLTISHARPRDAGTYACFFDLNPPVHLTHKLDVQYAPTVRALSPPEQHVTQDSTVLLQCRAHGNPEPTIRWFKQEGNLPSGHRSETGAVLEMTTVRREDEGTYLCTADNGIGEPSSAAMTISVDYPPEVTRLQSVVRTGEGDHVELVCIVHGRPTPEVVWTRDGHPLPDGLMDTHLHLPHDTRAGGASDYNKNHILNPDNRVHVQNHGPDTDNHHGRSSSTTPTDHVTVAHLAHRHTLTIHNVTEGDFGAYVCIAENTHGQTDAVIQMTGLPQPPQVTSSPQGGEGRSYTLTWTTTSYYPITEFLIRHRKTHLGWQPNRTVVMAGKWESISETVFSQPQDRGSDRRWKLNNPSDDTAPVADNGQLGGRNARRTHHGLTYTLRGLEEATDYVTVIRVRNKYGWSGESDHFNFSTKKAMAVLQSTSGASFIKAAASPVFQLLPISLLLPLSCFTLLLLSSPSHTPLL